MEEAKVEMEEADAEAARGGVRSSPSRGEGVRLKGEVDEGEFSVEVGVA